MDLTDEETRATIISEYRKCKPLKEECLTESWLPWVLTLSILLQLAAAGVSLRLAVISGFHKPWLCISAAIVLMAVRRMTSLLGIFGVADFLDGAHVAEYIALVISVLMLLGLALFRPAFERIQKRRMHELEAKDVLIRESHHQVKNDLQLLQGLVRLQQDSTRKEDERTFLNDLDSRIYSFSLLHESLYRDGLGKDSADERGGERGGLSFKRYLERLAAAVAEKYADHAVRMHLDLGDYPVAAKNILYAGLIVNEALTNAFKYGRPPYGAPEIRLQSTREGDEVRLTIADNGPGLPHGALESDELSSYGLTLIRTIGSNPGWKTELRNDGGAVVELRFPVSQCEQQKP